MREVSKEVIQLAGKGDNEAFEEIYNASSAYVYAVALRVCRNPEDAQEVVQDVFLKLYKHLWRFRFKAQLKTWIYRIAINTAINKYNKMKKRRRREVKNDILINNQSGGPEIDKVTEKEEQMKEVDKMLNKLNPGQKACMILRAVEGMSYEEISQTLKININTVKTRLKRARQILMRQTRIEERT